MSEDIRRMPLKSEEIAFIFRSRTCTACGHSHALHNHHCCDYCCIPGCCCWDGRMQSKPHVDNAPCDAHVFAEGA